MASRGGSGAQWRDGAQRRRAPRAWLPDDPTLGAPGGPRRRSGDAAGAAEAPDVLFEREWARGMFAAALERLRELCAREGKSQHFTLLEQYDLGTGTDRPSYAELARQLGIATTDVTNRLAWVAEEAARGPARAAPGVHRQRIRGA